MQLQIDANINCQCNWRPRGDETQEEIVVMMCVRHASAAIAFIVCRYSYLCDRMISISSSVSHNFSVQFACRVRIVSFRTQCILCDLIAAECCRIAPFAATTFRLIHFACCTVQADCQLSSRKFRFSTNPLRPFARSFLPLDAYTILCNRNRNQKTKRRKRV